MTHAKQPQPLYSDCQNCRHEPVYRTRQRQLGRTFQPEERLACAKHAPGTNQWHETYNLTTGEMYLRVPPYDVRKRLREATLKVGR